MEVIPQHQNLESVINSLIESDDLTVDEKYDELLKFIPEPLKQIEKETMRTVHTGHFNKFKVVGNPNENIPSAFIDLKSQYDSKLTIDSEYIDNLIKSIGGSDGQRIFVKGAQNDPTELYIRLLQYLPSLAKKFELKILEEIKCQENETSKLSSDKYVEQKENDEYTIRIPSEILQSGDLNYMDSGNELQSSNNSIENLILNGFVEKKVISERSKNCNKENNMEWNLTKYSKPSDFIFVQLQIFESKFIDKILTYNKLSKANIKIVLNESLNIQGQDYELSGMIFHVGANSADSGHYISKVKKGSQWYTIDDGEVILEELSFSYLENAPYILFYKKNTDSSSDTIPTGITNFGNTCYINSLIQNLMNLNLSEDVFLPITSFDPASDEEIDQKQVVVTKKIEQVDNKIEQKQVVPLELNELKTKPKKAKQKGKEKKVLTVPLEFSKPEEQKPSLKLMITNLTKENPTNSKITLDEKNIVSIDDTKKYKIEDNFSFKSLKQITETDIDKTYQRVFNSPKAIEYLINEGYLTKVN